MHRMKISTLGIIIPMGEVRIIDSFMKHIHCFLPLLCTIKRECRQLKRIVNVVYTDGDVNPLRCWRDLVSKARAEQGKSALKALPKEE